MKTKEQYMTIHELFRQGYNKTQIARILKISRNTVKKYLRCDTYAGYNTEHRHSVLEKFRTYIEDRLRVFPRLSSVRLYEELIAQGYGGGYRMLCKFVRKMRPVEQKGYIRVETKPGEQAQVDWAEFPQVKIGHEVVDLHGFMGILSYSRNRYIEFCCDEQLQTLENCHVHMFEYWKGVPLKIRYDNMRTVVDKREQGRPVFNEGFKDFAQFYGFTIDPCMPAHKEAKGKVERTVRYVRGNFFYARTFKSLDDLNHQARQWADKTANQRFSRLYGARICELLSAEHLQPLPAVPYNNRQVSLRKVQKDCLMSYHGNFYSVPHTHISTMIEVHDDGTHIYCFKDTVNVATHKKSRSSGQMIIDPQHYAGLKGHRRYVQLLQAHTTVLSKQTDAHQLQDGESIDRLLGKYAGWWEQVEKRDLGIYERMS